MGRDTKAYYRDVFFYRQLESSLVFLWLFYHYDSVYNPVHPSSPPESLLLPLISTATILYKCDADYGIVLLT